MRRKQLLDDVREKRGCWDLREEAADRTVRGSGFGRVCGTAVRQTGE